MMIRLGLYKSLLSLLQGVQGNNDRLDTSS